MALLAGAVGWRIRSLPTGPQGWLDGYVYVEAARTMLTDPAQLYHGALQQLHTSTPERAYIYPPSGVLPFLPLGWLFLHTNEQLATSVWLAWDTCALLLAVVLLGRALGASWERVGWMVLATAIAGPVLVNIAAMQVNGTLLLLFALLCRWYPGPRAGIPLGLMLALKPVLPLLLLYPLLRGQPRVALVGVATVAALNLGLLPWVGMEQARFYAFDFLPRAADHVFVGVGNVSLAGLLQVWIGGAGIGPGAEAVSPLQAPALATALTWATRLAVLGLWVVAVRRGPASDRTLLALTLGLIPVFTATVWAHYGVLLLPLLIIGMCSTARTLQRAAWLVVPVLLVGGPLSVFWVADIGRPHTWTDTAGYLRGVLAVVLSIAVTAWALARQGWRLRRAPGRPAAG